MGSQCQLKTRFVLSALNCLVLCANLSAQSTMGGRQRSNACTIIAVRFGAYCVQNNLDVSLLWKQLPQLWASSFISAICDGNAMYDEVYSDTAVYLDVDVVQSVDTECNVQSVSAIFGFTDANDFADLAAHISNVQQPSYGVLIGCGKSVEILVQTKSLCTLIDSHIRTSSGAKILPAVCKLKNFARAKFSSQSWYFYMGNV